MKSLFTLLFASLVLLPVSLRAQDQTPEDRFVRIYGLILQGDRTLENGRAAAAWTNYNDALTQLKKLKVDYPDWNTKIVKYRMDDLAAKMTDTVKKGAPATNLSASDMDDSKLELEPEGPVEFKLAWDIGKKYVHRVVQTMNTEASLTPERMLKQETKMTLELAFTPVKELEDGGREVDMEITAVAMDLKMDGSALSFDSRQEAEKDTNNPIAPVFRRLVGGKVKLITDTNGAVRSVQGIDEFVKHVAGAEAGGADAAGPLKSFLSEENLKTMSPLLDGMPDHPVRIGDTWTTKGEISMGALAETTANMNYTFKGWQMRDNRKVAVFDYSGDIASKPAAEGTPAAMVTIEQGKVSGRTWYAPVLHTVIATKGAASLSTKVNGGAAGSSTAKTVERVEANLVEGQPAAK